MSEIDFRSPRELLNAYKNGLVGVECNEEDVKKLLGELPMPIFGAAAYDLYGAGEGKISLPFKSLLKYDPEFGPSERQTTGDCVSHATRNAIDLARAVEIHIKKEPEAFLVRSATEGIYQSRGHYGQGMSCSGAARYVSQTGGILLRKDYGKIDLSVYNSSIGARHRIPKEIYEDEAKKHQVKTVSLITTVEEARDALANGYGISVCSGQGFSSRRDQHGIAKAQGSWAHAMAWIGCDDSRQIFNEMLFLVQNSWGRWNSGPKRLDQPDGSFWIRESVARRMLAGRGSWVFSNVEGFPARDLPDYGTTEYL